MLRKLREEIRECLQHAEDCARQAKLQRDPKLRDDFLDLERRWLKLARSYELTDRVEAFTSHAKRRRT
jgi:hypothetical protein